MINKEVIITEELPEENIENIKFLYIVIDSDLNIHYEFNNKGHIVLPIHWNELNPWRIYQNLPQNLIKKCASEKKNIIGVLQLWIYYTKDGAYARLRAIGLIESFQGNRLKALLKLVQAMDGFCKAYKIKFVEVETSVIPENVMKRVGFVPKTSQSWSHRYAQFISRQRAYMKIYF